MAKMEHSDIPSVIGHLLEELSWSGRKIKEVRGGGRGIENVLTAEVLQALDFLPRTAFLGAALRTAHAGSSLLKETLLAEVEHAALTVLPGSMDLFDQVKPPRVVQPDVVISTARAYCLVEAKGLGQSSFQACQLARELALAHQDAAGKMPALILILKTPPPIRIRGQGCFEIQAAIEANLIQVVSDDVRRKLICSQIAETVLWITWSEIASAVSGSLQDFKTDVPSTHACVARLAGALLSAIRWHGGKT
jgi:hypothetical protein